MASSAGKPAVPGRAGPASDAAGGAGGFTALLGLASAVFTVPSFAIFTDLLTGWACAPGRRTITAMVVAGDPAGQRAHDAYHRFVRDGAWATSSLWRVLATYAVGRFAPHGVVSLDVDDTLLHKTGRHIDGAGIFRDAVRSTARRVVHALGLNIVVLTLRVSPPWGGPPIGIPINARLHRKKDTTTTVEHAAAMVRELAGWLPHREFHLSADGAYASLCGAQLPRTHLTSRMRCDAEIYNPPPPPTGRPGRPRRKGSRLPKPTELATQVPKRGWTKTTVTISGKQVVRLVHTRDVLWYRTCPHQLVRLVIVRDPTGTQPDDFFFTTDLTATGADTITRYTGRWSIECTFRDAKQHIGAEQPQAWARKGPERAAALSLWLHAITWCWYLTTHPTGRTWTPRPWYPGKTTPSFRDALAALRRALWADRITTMSGSTHDPAKIQDALLDAVAHAT